MSTTITHQDMRNELARRVPIGYTADVADAALNGAFRWINQQGSFPWLLRKVDITTTNGVGTFTMPADFDPGKQAILYGMATSVIPTEIPFMPWNEAVRHQSHQTAVANSGVISCWSFYATIASQTVTFVGALFPAVAVKTGTEISLVYHARSFPTITTGYYPTPDHFDYLILELAEAEIMRQYRLAGWEILYKRVTDQLRGLLGAYTTTKTAMTPTAEVINNANLAQAQRAS